MGTRLEERVHTRTGIRNRLPQGRALLASLLALGLTFPPVATAAPAITTQQILGKVKAAPGARTVAARVPGSVQKEAGTLETIGEAPAGFGLVFNWNRSDAEVSLVAFINAADPNGIAITNVKSGDRITVESATGSASFAEGNGKLISGIIGVVSAGVVLAAPEAAPLVAAGAKLAQEQFGKPNTAKVRNAFGREGATLRRCEGGVLVTLPAVGGVLDSLKIGDAQGCIKGPDDKNGSRFDSRRPAHVRDAFFLIPGVNTRLISTDGVVHLVAWDRSNGFGDNQGFYRVIIRLTRKDAVRPTPPLPLVL